MCGITGFIQWNGDLMHQSEPLLNMTQTLSDRGPDAAGTWISNPCAFGHRRLSVMDPENGAQPMIRQLEDITYTIVYNGEIYNAPELKKSCNSAGIFSVHNATRRCCSNPISNGALNVWIG